MLNNFINQEFRSEILDMVSIKYLDQALLERCGIFAFEKASEILHHEKEKQCKAFIRLIETSLYTLSEVKSYMKRTVVNPPSQNVSLIQNVNDYLEGKITEPEVKYHFLALLSYNGSLRSTRGYSIYNHTLAARVDIKEYLYHYRPVISYNIAEDGYFTENSYLFGVNELDEDFLCCLDYNFLLMLQSVSRGIATIPENPVELFPNLDTLITQKRETIEKLRQINCYAADYWASRGI